MTSAPAVTRMPRPISGWLSTLGRLVLGGVWIAAGLTKITDLDAAVRAVRAYRLLPELAAQIAGAGLPMIELVLGGLLLADLAVRAAAVVSAVLMVTYLIAISSAWARGLQIDCGCFGSGGQLAAGTHPTYGWDLTRDTALLLLAALLIRRPTGRYTLDALLADRRDNP